MAAVDDLKEEITEYIRLRLGGDMVQVELDPAHYTMAIKQAFRKYRTSSERGVEESYAFLTLEEGVNNYTLDSNITEVRQVLRRTVGGMGSTSGSDFEPFHSGFLSYYILRAGRSGGMLSYELWSAYQEQSMKMFGGYLNFHWDTSTKKLQLIRDVRADGEEVLLWIYNNKPDEHLLNDQYAYLWLQDYALAVAKVSLGEARSKFATYVGPQGGTTLNGDSLIAAGTQEMIDLEAKLQNYDDGGMPMWWVIG
jgi:hypothetical protein